MVIISGFILILAILLFKYKPVYEVIIAGQKIGFVENVDKFKSLIEDVIINQEGTNIANVSLIEQPQYLRKLYLRESSSNEEEILEKLSKENTIITYDYYEVALNNETKALVNTLEEAQKVVNQIKNEFDGDDLELDLQINEKYTFNKEEINTDTLEVASNNVEKAAQQIKDDSQALAIINDIRLSVLPVNGKITSRYGESSRIRSSTHTGLDIACTTGTPIKVVSTGTVTFAGTSGAYGNLVKIDHGNGVETWYGHCSKIYVKSGQKVEAGDVIAAVGSTGNSTGPHLHFEIRIDSKTVNPQNYVY